MAKEQTIRDCLIWAKEGRGITLVNQNPVLSSSHFKKAMKNIEVMNYLRKGDYLDWTIIAAYYSMYQACLAILARIGIQSKNHACTIAVIEKYFAKSGKIDIKFVEQCKSLSALVEKIEKVKIEQKLIEALKDARDNREDFQYDVISEISAFMVEETMKNCIEFSEQSKILLSNLENEFIEAVRKSIKSLN